MIRQKQLRVAFCVPNIIIGGVETVFVNTIDELVKNPELEIQIVTHAKIREPLYVNWLKSHPEIQVYVYYPLCNWFEDIAPKCRGIFKILRKVVFSVYKKYRRIIVKLSGRFNNIDVFVDYKNFEFFKELKYFHKPKIAWAHSALSYFESCGAFTRLSQYTKIVGITDDFVTDFKEKYPKYADKIVRIYNPMNVGEIKTKAKQGHKPRGKYFCHVSRLVPGKDIKTLLDAFEIFYKSHKDVKLYIVGDGEKSDEFKAYAGTLKSNKNIVFTGVLDNPYGVMKGAIANILSSEYEGFGIVLIESMVLAKPIISSNCKSGPSEILEQGKAGLLFKVGNAKQLCECMERIYKEKDLAERLVIHASKSLKRFNQPEIEKQVAGLVHQVKGQ